MCVYIYCAFELTHNGKIIETPILVFTIRWEQSNVGTWHVRSNVDFSFLTGNLYSKRKEKEGKDKRDSKGNYRQTCKSIIPYTNKMKNKNNIGATT